MLYRQKYNEPPLLKTHQQGHESRATWPSGIAGVLMPLLHEGNANGMRLNEDVEHAPPLAAIPVRANQLLP